MTVLSRAIAILLLATALVAADQARTTDAASSPRRKRSPRASPHGSRGAPSREEEEEKAEEAYLGLARSRPGRRRRAAAHEAASLSLSMRPSASLSMSMSASATVDRDARGLDVAPPSASAAVGRRAGAAARSLAAWAGARVVAGAVGLW